MSALTASIASSWSARLAVGEGALEPQLPLAVGGEAVPATRLALGVEVDQLAGELARGAAGARLHLLPALAAELRELRALAAADVAGDLRQLLRRDQHPVAVAVLELEVVAGDPGDGAGVEAGEAGDAVVLVDDVLARGQVPERGEAATARRRRRGPPAVDEAPVGDHGELHRRGDEAVRDRRLGEEDRRGDGRRAVGEDRRGQPLERVLRSLPLADPLEGDDGDVAGAQLLLELGLGLGEVARRRDGDRGAELVLVVVAVVEQAQRRALGQRLADRDVELGDVLVVDRRAHVGQVVVEGALDLVGSGDDDRRALVDQVEEGAEAVDREQLGERALGSLVLGVGQRLLGEDPVIGVDLGGGVELDPLRLRERALGEGREVADRLDLVAEQLEPRRLVLGRAEDVEDPPANGELTAVGDLLDPLVAAAGEQLGDVAEIDLLPAAEREAGRAQGRVRHRLAEGDGAGDDDRGLLRLVADERVERRDPQADEVRRRRQVGLVAGSARGVQAHPARRQVGAELGGEVAGAGVVGGDAEQRPAGEAGLRLGQGGEQERAQAGRDARLNGPGSRIGERAGQLVEAGVAVSELEQRAQRHGSSTPGSRGRGPRSARPPAPRPRRACAPRRRPTRAACA